YQAVVGNLSGISGTTVTVNTVAGANTFLNCPYAYISGAGGVSNRLVFLSSPGGVNGAWTVQASQPIINEPIGATGLTTYTGTLANHPIAPGTVFIYDNTGHGGCWAVDNGAGAFVNGNKVSSGTINYATGAYTVTFTSAAGSAVVGTYGFLQTIAGYTSGGTLNGGAVQILRAVGYTCPLVIDTGSSGEDPFDITNFSAVINNSDPQKNCIFSLHPYQSMLPFQGIIASVTQGNPTVLTLNSNSAV